MIKNEKQYRITKKSAIDFSKALEHLKKAEDQSELVTIQISALQSQYEELKEDIEKYEGLKNGTFNIIKSRNLDSIYEILIETRIASNMTQKQLAEKMNLKEQQIQRYESDDYANASLNRIREVCEALNIKLWFEKLFVVNSNFSFPEDVNPEDVQDMQEKVKRSGSVMPMIIC